MDHSMMGMGSSPSPSATSGAMQMDSSDNMMMMMQMWFQASTSVTLWFKEWKTDTQAKYAVSIIGLLLLCIAQEAISRTRTAAMRRWGASSFSPLDSSSSDAGQPSPYFPVASFRKRLPSRIALSLLYALNITTSYLLMLAVMTFNIGYFITVVSGLALGHFIFFPASQPGDSPGMLSEACCPQS